jgi:tRNA G37 N-methylase TrmD
MSSELRGFIAQKTELFSFLTFQCGHWIYLFKNRYFKGISHLAVGDFVASSGELYAVYVWEDIRYLVSHYVLIQGNGTKWSTGHCRVLITKLHYRWQHQCTTSH